MTQEYLLAIQDFDELKLAVRQVNCIDQLSLSLSLTVNIDLLTYSKKPQMLIFCC